MPATAPKLANPVVCHQLQPANARRTTFCLHCVMLPDAQQRHGADLVAVRAADLRQHTQCSVCHATVTAAPRHGDGKVLVYLSAAGNPDRDEPEDIGVDAEQVRVGDLMGASLACRGFMGRYGLGGGNWTGGHVFDTDGRLIARISYNGRAWRVGEDGRATSQQIELD